MGTDCGLRGLPLLDAVIEQIEAHPETWNQGDYRCDSGMCVAGHAASMTGGRWADPDPDSADGNLLLAEDGDDPRGVWSHPAYGRVITASRRAARVLMLGQVTADSLFYGYNDLEDIRYLRNGIANSLAAAQ